MMVVAWVISVLALAVILSPFIWAKDQKFSSGLRSASTGDLESNRREIVRQYLAEEKIFHEGETSEREWRARQSHLLGRFIDVTRQLDKWQAEG